MLRPLRSIADRVGDLDERTLDRRIDPKSLPAELQPMAEFPIGVAVGTSLVPGEQNARFSSNCTLARKAGTAGNREGHHHAIAALQVTYF